MAESALPAVVMLVAFAAASVGGFMTGISFAATDTLKGASGGSLVYLAMFAWLISIPVVLRGGG